VTLAVSGPGPNGLTDEDPCEVPDADPALPEVPEPDNADDCGRPDSRLRRIARVVVPLLIAAAVVVVVASSAGDAGAMVHALRRVDPRLALGAVMVEAASFAFLGLHLRLLGGPDANVRRLAPFRVATIVFGLGSVMPAAPAEGLVMASTALKHRRLARGRTILVLGVSSSSAPWASTCSPRLTPSWWCCRPTTGRFGPAASSSRVAPGRSLCSRGWPSCSPAAGSPRGRV